MQSSSRGLREVCRLLGYSRQAYYQYQKSSVNQSFKEDIVIQQVIWHREIQPRVGGRKLLEMMEPFMKDHTIEMGRDHMEDMNLDVDFLCRHLYISRKKLYQKIKGISDQSVGEFIRTVRHKKSIQIMTHEDIAMNEVADRVGMQSSSNFSRAFKKEYGKSPLQFMQSLRKMNV